METFRRCIGWIPPLLDGAKITILLTLAAVSAGLVGSLFLALGKMSKHKWLSSVCSAYIFFFRGTPLLMQLFFVYFALPQIFPALTLSRFAAAYVAFSLNIAAYLAEIIRAAIQSIDKGQMEAARSLGLSYGQAMRLVVIPQAYRRMIPPICNEFVMVLKDTSLVAIIALVDLTYQTKMIMSNKASTLVFVPAMIIYLILTGIFTMVFNRLETKFSAYE